jgi:hypothetical protein
MRMDRLQRGGRFRHYQFGVGGEKCRHSGELAVVDTSGIAVHQIAEGGPVSYGRTHEINERRCAHADKASFACSISVVGGMASTTRSAP